MWEETGLRLTYVREENMISSKTNGYETIGFSSPCVAQNPSGGHSIIIRAFLCCAVGALQTETDETTTIRWVLAETVETMHIYALNFFEY